MFTNHISKIVVVLLVLAIAFVSVSFVAHSSNTPTADRSYDRVEQARVDRSAPYNAYDPIEALRAQREATSLIVASSDDRIEQVRMERAFPADRSYDHIEALRLQR
jgi:hypothetical protein